MFCFNRALPLFAFFLASFFGLLSTVAHATSSLKSSCYLQDKSTGDVQGVNIDELYPIASVSKIFTSYWALEKMGPGGRFQTQFFVRKISDDSFDVHIQGAHDPYFGKWVLQFVSSELNRLGVKRIRLLTYDENFKFLNDTTGGLVAMSHFDNVEPTVARVSAELQVAFKNISAGYDKLRVRSRDKRDLIMPLKIELQVEEVRFLSTLERRPDSDEIQFSYSSAPLKAILKEMNRNSNNHAANQIFEALGGQVAFERFIERKGFTLEQIHFYNGSGDRKDLYGNVSVYNRATCRAIIQITQLLRNRLKDLGLNLEDVLSVAGRQAEGERGTVEMYKNDDTEGALLAKTGTVNPAISLAGMMCTEEGDIYFGYVFKTDGGADWTAARSKIRTAVTQMIKKFGGGEPLKYRAEAFFPFDQGSKLTAVDRGLRP